HVTGVQTLLFRSVREPARHFLPDVVPGALVAATGISEPDHDHHRDTPPRRPRPPCGGQAERARPSPRPFCNSPTAAPTGRRAPYSFFSVLAGLASALSDFAALASTLGAF